MMNGNLSSVSLGEIFQTLSVNNHTGTLKIVEKSSEEKYIYFSKGEVCLFSIKSHPSLRLGEILVRQGKILHQDLEDALAIQAESRELLGKILMRTCKLTPEDIHAALETKIREEIYDLFLLSEAEFEFHMDHLPEEVFDSFQKSLRIAINTFDLLIEGLRRTDEWKVIEKKIQTFNEIFKFSAASPARTSRNPAEEALLKRLDGETPVRRLFDSFPGSRFECCKLLFELFQTGRIRFLNYEECLQADARAVSRQDLAAAADIMAFAVEVEPNEPDAHELFARHLKEIEREPESLKAFLRATHLYFARGRFDKALEIGESVVRHFTRDEELLEVVFQSALSCNNLPAVATYGDWLADLKLNAKNPAGAAETLLKVIEHHPKELNRKIRAAEVLKASGDPRSGVVLLEDVVKSLSGNQNIRDRIKVLRLIFELAPERQDIKQEITNLLALQDRLEHRKKQRFTIAGAAAIALLLLMVLPLLYELKARELLSHAARLEEISINSGNFLPAKSAFEELVKNYSFSTQVGAARKGLERIAAYERLKLNRLEGEKTNIQQAQEEKLRRIRESLHKLIDESKKLEAGGDFKGAFEILKRAVDEFPEAPQLKGVNLPVTITSRPKGCLVQINGTNVGITPLVIHRRLHEAASIQLSRFGCESSQRSVIIGSEWRIHFEMNLRPVAEFKLSGAIHHRLDASGTNLLFPSRDGYFYSVNPATKLVTWRRLFGRFGDLPSEPCYTPLEVVLGNVWGRITVFSKETGKARWALDLNSPIIAPPAVSPDGRWVAAGSLDGWIRIIDNRNGSLVGTFATENEILRGPVFHGSLLAAASEDNNLYLLSVPEARPLHVETLPAEIDRHPVLLESRIFFPTRDGVLHAYDLDARRSLWSRKLPEPLSNQPQLYKGQLLAGTRSGKILAFGVEDGGLLWELEVSKAGIGDFLVWQDDLYTGTAAGEVLGIDLPGRVQEWVFRSDESIIRAPVLIDKRLFVPSASGKFYVLEIQE